MAEAVMNVINRFTPKMLLVYFLAAVCLGVLALYCYAYFYEVPYMGFHVQAPNEVISNILISQPGEPQLQEGDIIVEIGNQDFFERAQSGSLPLFPPFQAGDVAQLTIRRDGEILHIDWIVPGVNTPELIYRLANYWYLAAIYWIFGLLTVVLIRPRDERWALMIALFFLIGLWVGFGAASTGKVWHSSLLMRMVTWPMLAVSLHFHWVFPKPLRPLKPIHLAGLYGIFLSLSVAEFFGLLPTNAYLFGIGFFFLMSLVFLVLHVWLQPDQRRVVNVILVLMAIILVLVITTSLQFYFNQSYMLVEISLFSLILIPVVYFYAVYASQTGGMEIRRSRILGLTAFTALVFGAVILLILIARLLTDESGILVMTVVLLAAGAGLVGALGYPSFQRRFDRLILRSPALPPDLLPWYSARLAESLDVQHVVELLRDRVLPGLLVRQAAILLVYPSEPVGSKDRIVPLLLLGILPDELPSEEELIALKPDVGKYRPVMIDTEGVTDPCPWVRLVLPLKIESRYLAICLLGRKDPDDTYTFDEITLLQALMDQTALSLVHIEHAGRLRLLYQADIQRQEDERNRLARELHDQLLGQMALIIQNVSTNQDQQAFMQVYRPAVQEIRSIIAGLRPAMLNYGLKAALEELAENPVDFRTEGKVPRDTHCSLEGGLARYPDSVELHLYRIVQQAWRNAIQHANPRSLMLTGTLDDQCVHLEVIDDGVGFDTPHTPDLGVLLARQQYGLVGMLERAALIQAELTIDSAPGQGTRVKVTWQGMTSVLPDQSTKIMSSG